MRDILFGIIGLVSMLVFAYCSSGCGASVKQRWMPLDSTAASDIAGASTSLEAICDRSGGSCNPAAVRSIEQSIFCAARAMSQRHGDPVPSGPACPTTTESK